MKIALGQINIAWENKVINYKKVELCAEEASTNGAQFIFFPEMSLTGFSMNVNVTGENDDWTLNHMRDLSRKYNIGIGIGWVLLDNGMGQNHYSIVQNGKLLSDYKKIHPFSYAEENKYFEAGEEIHTFLYNGYKIGTVICYDLRFPELFQALSKDATVIVIPANWPQKRESHWSALLKARAIENQCYIVGINCVGKVGDLNYCGGSMVISPAGEVITEDFGNETILYADIDADVEEIRREFPVKQDRKPELYERLRQLTYFDYQER